MGYFTTFDGGLNVSRRNAGNVTRPSLKGLAETVRGLRDGSVKDPEAPSLWSPWEINEYGDHLYIRETKSQEYVEWLKFIIKNVYEPFDVAVNGVVYWRGESDDDFGRISVSNNKVSVALGSIVYTGHSVWCPEEKVNA